ncbi:hypothetical protein [Pseudomonas citronellolis]|uniref:hypothetical protein n=1 Tax=Pseudomonas citronellolis TaxID=53408 RepID=UPI0008533828|nr:hypothetical protein [Pseudomonas humi]
MHRQNGILDLFDSNEVIILSDNETFNSLVSEQGWPTANLAELSRAPQCSVVFSFSDAAAIRSHDLAAQYPGSRMVFCALHVFDASLETALYSFDLMCASDFKSALEKQCIAAEMMETSSRLRLCGQGADGWVDLDSSVKPYALLKSVEGPFVHSVAEFFEVHHAHLHRKQAAPFWVSGEFLVSGVLSVMRPTGRFPYENSTRDVDAFVQKVAAANSVKMIVTDNKVTSFCIDAEEQVDFLRILGGDRQELVTEFAIGVNEAIEEKIDYARNSQLNEGIEGIHLAIGDGVSGYHIDFLCPSVGVEVEG